MELILLENVAGLGERGARVQVARGYARNFLLPKKLALPATSTGAKMFSEAERVRRSRGEQERHHAEGLAKQLAAASVTIPAQVGEDEKLFGSVTAQDIVDALHAQGLEIERRRIQLEEPLRVLGVYKINVKLHPEISVPLKVWVTKQ
ncbi:MAG: 50S ribosomal protein L9 [Candidatus Eisenbacteria sp.]|nr:50S ribosomal protein L9 [Candidatus Eisenbacteria bacterium]